MLLGFGSFAQLPFSTTGDDNNVTIVAVKNELTISIGNPGISAEGIVEIPSGNELTLGLGTVTATGDTNIIAVKNTLVISSGTVTITADANVSPTGSGLTLATGTLQAITWSEILPGATMTWTPIDTSA